MDDGEAFGGSKVGAPFDPVVFVKKPIVIIRLTALVSCKQDLYCRVVRYCLVISTVKQ